MSASVLPRLNGAPSKAASNVQSKLSDRKQRTQNARGARNRGVGPLKNDHAREINDTNDSRGKSALSTLADDMCTQKLSHEHGLCLDMLVRGYVNSFCEFFYETQKLTSQSFGPKLLGVNSTSDTDGTGDAVDGEATTATESNSAGVDGHLQRKRNPIAPEATQLLEATGVSYTTMQHCHTIDQVTIDRLDYMHVCLTAAEAAGRRNDFSTVFLTQKKLALFFEDALDFGTAMDFWQDCLRTTQLMDDSNIMEAEVYCCLGQSWEKRSENSVGGSSANGEAMIQLRQALEYFELFHKTTLSLPENYNHRSDMLHRACKQLLRLYQRLADNLESSNDMTAATKYHHLALDKARECGDASAIGLINFRLGQACSNPEISITYHLAYLESCRKESDTIGEGRAHAALSESYLALDDVPNAIKCLEAFIGCAEATKQHDNQAEACNKLGMIYNNQGDFEQAVRYFTKHYDISREQSNLTALAAARVQVGIARAHAQMNEYVLCVRETTEAHLLQLLNFKRTKEPFNPPKPKKESFIGTTSNE